MKNFVLRAFAWTLVMLTLWYWLAAWIAPPMSIAAGYLMHLVFPDWVNASGWNHAVLVLFTDLPLTTVGEIQAKRFNAYANMSMLGMGLPFYIALLLASKAKSLWLKIVLGTLMLIPFMLWSISFTWLAQVLSERGAYAAQELGVNVWQFSLIGLGAQMGKLIFPVMIPVLIWLGFERRFVVDTLVHKNHTTQQ